MFKIQFSRSVDYLLRSMVFCKSMLNNIKKDSCRTDPFQMCIGKAEIATLRVMKKVAEKS